MQFVKEECLNLLYNMKNLIKFKLIHHIKNKTCCFIIDILFSFLKWNVNKSTFSYKSNYAAFSLINKHLNSDCVNKNASIS